jgi:hypothetical protein
MSVKRINIDIGWLIEGLVFIGIAQAIYGLGQYRHLFNNITNSDFLLSGSFDNPAGFAATLSVCFPFALYLVSKKQIYWRITGSLAAVIYILLQFFYRSLEPELLLYLLLVEYGL